MTIEVKNINKIGTILIVNKNNNFLSSKLNFVFSPQVLISKLSLSLFPKGTSSSGIFGMSRRKVFISDNKLLSDPLFSFIDFEIFFASISSFLQSFSSFFT